ncbi:MAG: DUF937 domain-containing protein [Bacteroidia bacterium]|nr:DUF937 domain-containing protein [Bacteroidia bacterium]NNC85205.1 DUF937 domain-containing protein [Bacteroidia bacterium]NNM16907.1 DUF937 domain-containing protein [Bacteroidia bacterium]
MSELLGALMGQLTQQNAVSAIGKQVGANDQTTTKALQYAIPVLLGALANNTSNNSGAAALDNALTKDHDGSILNDIVGAVAGGSNSGLGAGILKHVLGGQRNQVQQQLSAQTGLSSDGMGQVLEIAAPILMGMLGKQKRENNLGASALASMLGGAKQEAADAPFGPSMDMLGALLGGGSSRKSGLMGAGMSILKGFLKK